jgi:hypothetical protein
VSISPSFYEQLLCQNLFAKNYKHKRKKRKKLSYEKAAHKILAKSGNTKRGKYHCTIDLLFDWFGLVCFASKNKNCQ